MTKLRQRAKNSETIGGPNYYSKEHILVKPYFMKNLSQPWESVVAVGNAVVNAVLCGIYDSKKLLS